jgi:hypothetical protein
MYLVRVSRKMLARIAAAAGICYYSYKYGTFVRMPVSANDMPRRLNAAVVGHRGS